MNHDAQRGMTRGAVLIGDGGFFLRASFSSFGVTRYDDRARRDMVAAAAAGEEKVVVGKEQRKGLWLARGRAAPKVFRRMAKVAIVEDIGGVGG